jgi:predicted nucleic acid-binding protein
MAPEVFVDSSGLYALADHRDPFHSAADRCVRKLLAAGIRLVLTDYIVDESMTLAVARAGSPAALRLLDIVEKSSAFDWQWIERQRFAAALAFFRKHADHHYSFTDCTSFVVMRELGLREALTTDKHFAEAGFRMLFGKI